MIDFGAILSALHILPVLVAAVAGFVFGAIYYMTFGKAWMAALGTTAEEIRGNKSMVPFITAFVAQVVMATMLYGIIHHIGDMTVRRGMISATFIWIGFVITTMAVNHGFQGSKRMLTLIDGAYWLGVLLIQGAVIGYLGGD